LANPIPDTVNYGTNLNTEGMVGYENPASLIATNIDGVALNTFGFVWDSADIWEIVSNPPTTTWVAVT